VENGWALPTFYETMTATEISLLNDKAKSAHKNFLGIWKDYSNQIVPFDFDLFTLNKPPYIEPMSDKGKFIMPKIYRRQVNYEVNRRAKIITDSSLKGYIKKGKDKCFKLSEFAAQGTKAKIHYLDEYISKEGKIKVLEASDLVFKEAPATLRNHNGKRILKWI
jgi:hypothetical protein